MFCPKCRYEYRMGFFRCSDCDVELVHELPEEENNISPLQNIPTSGNGGYDYESFVHLFDTTNDSEQAFIASLLEAEGIEFYFLGENTAKIHFNVIPVRLMVRAEQAEKAIDTLNSAYEDSQQPFEPQDPDYWKKEG